jgi:hypothetical protein
MVRGFTRPVSVKFDPDVFADALAFLPALARLAFPLFIVEFCRTRRSRSTRDGGSVARASRITPVPRSLRLASPPQKPALLCNGYRFAKSNGKPSLSPWHKSLRHKGFCDAARLGGAFAFRFDSSRYLNCSSNLTGHDHPNAPGYGGR